MLNYPIINIISHNWEELCCDAIGLKTNFRKKKIQNSQTAPRPIHFTKESMAAVTPTTEIRADEKRCGHNVGCFGLLTALRSSHPLHASTVH